MSETGNKGNLTKLIGSIAVPAVAAIIAGLFSMNAKEVYGALKLPAFAPPPELFAPVWIVLYLLMGISLYLIVRHGFDTPGVKSAVCYFLLQLGFNVLWSVLFFGLGLHVAALADIIILFIYILITFFKFLKIDKAAALLLLPYLLWVAFASILNLAVVLLNG